MKIALLGDIGLFGSFCSKSGINIEDYFHDFISITSDCDFIIGNLETPFTDKFKEYSAKSAYIGSFKENIKILKKLNISHVNLANNHTGDFGKEGYDLTKRTLKNHGIKYYGIEGLKEFIIHDDNRISLTGYCNMDSNPVYLSNPKKCSDKGVNVADVSRIIKDFEELESLGFLNILAFHSGLEHVNLPGVEDIKFARYLADKFDYILYGHHPHVVQAYEKFNESYLFYSLGNFCFDDIYLKSATKPSVEMSEANKVGLIPILTIEDNKVVSVDYIWTYLGSKKIKILNDTHQIVNNVNNINLSDLNACKIKRKQLLEDFIIHRKNKRDLQWYLRRLRLRYVMLYLNSINNRKLYKKHYLSQLKRLKII